MGRMMGREKAADESDMGLKVSSPCRRPATAPLSRLLRKTRPLGIVRTQRAASAKSGPGFRHQRCASEEKEHRIDPKSGVYFWVRCSSESARAALRPPA